MTADVTQRVADIRSRLKASMKTQFMHAGATMDMEWALDVIDAQAKASMWDGPGDDHNLHHKSMSMPDGSNYFAIKIISPPPGCHVRAGLRAHCAALAGWDVAGPRLLRTRRR